MSGHRGRYFAGWITSAPRAGSDCERARTAGSHRSGQRAGVLRAAGRVCTNTSGDAGMKKASTRLLEQETQTPSPAPDLIPAESSTENLHWDWYSKRGHFTRNHTSISHNARPSLLDPARRRTVRYPNLLPISSGATSQVPHTSILESVTIYLFARFHFQ